MATKRLFIVGCPRSGTTWTLMLLAQHPKTVAAQHLSFFHALRPLEDWWLETQKRKQGAFGQSVVSIAKDAASPDQGVKFDDIISEERFYAMCRGAADALFSGILEHRPDAELLIEKTPENVRIAPFITKVYPDAYFLHIVRDPRAVYASLKSAVKTFEKSAAFPGNPIAGARFWEDDVSRGVAIPEVSDRYLEVRYESMLANGEAELARIYEWLGLPVAPDFCAKAVEAASMKNLRKIESAPKSFFRRGEADGWKDELTAEEIRILEYMLGDWLDRLGYERTLGTDVKKPVKLALEQQLQSTVNRLERSLVRTARRFGYVIPVKAKPHRKGR